MDPDGAAAGQQYRAFDDMLELANIARPGVCVKRGISLGQYYWREQSVAVGGLFSKMPGQEHDIFCTLAQGRHCEVQHIQSEVQIRAQLSRSHHLFNWTVSSSDKPGRNRPFL